MKKKLLSLLFTSLLFVGVSTVKASTDINDWTINVETITGAAANSVHLSINGEFEKGNVYFVKFVNEGDEKPVANHWESVETSKIDFEKFKNVSTINNIISVSENWYLLKGYDYAYFLKCGDGMNDGCVSSEKPVKVIRPEMPELDKRFDFNYSADVQEFSAMPLIPYDYENTNFVFKLGVINNKELLYSLSKKEDGSLEKLLEYAEEAKDKVYEYTGEKVQGNKIDKIDIINGGYYYMYAAVKDADGKYRNVKGVAVGIGKKNYISNDIEWNLDISGEEVDNTNDNDSNATVEEEKPKEEKVEKNPSTTDTNIALILGALAVCGSLIVIGKKKISAK